MTRRDLTDVELSAEQRDTRGRGDQEKEWRFPGGSCPLLLTSKRSLDALPIEPKNPLNHGNRVLRDHGEDVEQLQHRQEARPQESACIKQTNGSGSSIRVRELRQREGKAGGGGS